MTKGRTARDDLLERLLNLVLGSHVDAGRGVVEDEDRGVDEESPGDGESLTLAAGEADAALADMGIVSSRGLLDEVV